MRQQLTWEPGRGRTEDSFGLCEQTGRRCQAGNTPETAAGDSQGGGKQCENPWQLQGREEQKCVEKMKSCHFTAPFHLFSPILNSPLLMLPKAVASQAFPPWLSTANGDVHFASLVYQTASQLPCLAPAIIPTPTARGAWG